MSNDLARDFALAYAARGWRVIRWPPRTKGSKQKGWPGLASSDAETVRARFNGAGEHNIGVLLGPPCDVDLDCAEALIVAGYFLPPTGMMFGRASTRMAHRVYISDAGAIVGKAVLNFDDPENPGPHMIELRCGGGGKAAQTIFPGSIHESGEPIKFENGFDGEPAKVDGTELIDACKRSAAAALVARAWPAEGGHHPAQVLGGFLARAGMDAPAVDLFASAVLAHVGGPNAKDHVRTARAAAEAYQDGRNAYGLPQLAETFGEKRAKRITEWLHYSEAPQRPSGAERASQRPNGLPPCSDQAIALEFAERHKDGLRYTHAWGKWHRFSGGRWQDDDTLLTYDLASALCREAAAGAKEAERKDTMSAKKRAAVVSLAREDRRFAASVEQWDADPWMLNTPRSTIDLRTMEEREHRACDYITRSTAAAPGGRCPRWDQFIREITAENDSLAGFLQRVAGYALTGDTSEHALFFGHGGGGNGKSVFISTVAGIIGDYHRVAPIETFTASVGNRHPTELAMLRGARLVTAVETEEGRPWAESKIKTLTGGDRISARFMHQNYFEFTPQFKLLIAGNHKPALRNVDEAIRRRFHMIPFNLTIPADKRDPSLLDKLKEEWPGILQWMLDGCADWQERGLAAPETVTAATAAYLEAEDDVAAWIEGCCERRGEAPLAMLNGDWRAWAENSGLDRRTNKWLRQALEARGFEARKTMNGLQIMGLRIRYRAGQAPA